MNKRISTVKELPKKKILTIRLVTSEKCLEVTGEDGQSYLLRPNLPFYYDIVEKIAYEQIGLGNNRVPLSAVNDVISELLMSERWMNSRKRRHYGTIGVDSFYTYWTQRFTEGKYWEVTAAAGTELSDTEAAETRRGVFRKRATKSGTEYWLGDVPDVRILGLEGVPTSSVIADVTRDPAKDWERLCEYCKGLLESSVSRVASEYDPLLYVHRLKAEELFKNFLKSPQNLFLMIGRSGTGKTNVMCELARTTPHPALLMSGEFYAAGGFSLQREISESLYPLCPSEATTRNMAAWVNNLADENQGTFLIYIDALNKFADPAVVLQELCACVSRYGAAYPRIKFCVACKSPVWESISGVGKAGVPQQNVYLSADERTTPPFLEPSLTASLVLGDFDHEELELAVECYRGRWEFKGGLSWAAETLCRTPLLLRLVARAWKGKRLPRRLDTRAVWDAYWQETVRSGPEGSDELVLEIASAMRAQQTIRVSKTHAASLSSYSAAKLGHLVDEGVLCLREREYERWVMFWHERLFEYAVARSLLSSGKEVFEDVPSLVHMESLRGSLRGVLCFLVQMLDDRAGTRLLRGVARTGSFGCRLACDVIEELDLTSTDAWSILDAASIEDPELVASVVGRIGASAPEMAFPLLTKLIERSTKWDRSAVSFFSECLTRSCGKSELFLRESEVYLKRGSRYKQVYLEALCQIDTDADWSKLKDAIVKFSKAHDELLREAVAHVLPYFARHEPDTAEKVISQMAGDRSERVRSRLAFGLSMLGSDDSKWLRLLASLSKNKDWRKRRVSAWAIGDLLSRGEGQALLREARRLCSDPSPEVRFSLAREILLLPYPEGDYDSSALLLVEDIVSKATHGDVCHLSHLLWHRGVPPQIAQRWSLSESPKVREFLAGVWRGRYSDIPLDVVPRLAKDSSVRVRMTLADRLAAPQPWRQGDYADGIFKAVARLVKDRSSRVRDRACAALFWFGSLKRDECISLLLERLIRDRNYIVQRCAYERLMWLGAGRAPEVRCAVEDFVRRTWSPERLENMKWDLRSGWLV